MTAVSTKTQAKLVHAAFQPRKHSGTSSFHTAMQLNTKLKSAFTPVHPPNTANNALKIPNKTASQPMRQ